MEGLERTLPLKIILALLTLFFIASQAFSQVTANQQDIKFQTWVLAEEIPMGRFGSPEEVGKAVVSLLSNSYMTGQIIGLDGGYF